MYGFQNATCRDRRSQRHVAARFKWDGLHDATCRDDSFISSRPCTIFSIPTTWSPFGRHDVSRLANQRIPFSRRQTLTTRRSDLSSRHVAFWKPYPKRGRFPGEKKNYSNIEWLTQTLLVPLTRCNVIITHIHG